MGTVDFTDSIYDAQLGSQSAVKFIYDNTIRYFNKEAFVFFQDKNEADKAIRDAYIFIFEHLNSLEDSSKFLFWANEVCKTTCISRIRQTGVFEEQVPAEASNIGDILPASEYDSMINMEAAMSPDHIQICLDAILNSLPDNHRVCAVLWGEGYPIQSIARKLGMSRSAVNYTLAYTLGNITNSVIALGDNGLPLFSMEPIPFFLWLLLCYYQFCEPDESMPCSESAFENILKVLLPEEASVFSAEYDNTAEASNYESGQPENSRIRHIPGSFENYDADHSREEIDFSGITSSAPSSDNSPESSGSGISGSGDSENADVSPRSSRPVQTDWDVSTFIKNEDREEDIEDSGLPIPPMDIYPAHGGDVTDNEKGLPETSSETESNAPDTESGMQASDPDTQDQPDASDGLLPGQESEQTDAPDTEGPSPADSSSPETPSSETQTDASQPSSEPDRRIRADVPELLEEEPNKEPKNHSRLIIIILIIIIVILLLLAALVLFGGNKVRSKVNDLLGTELFHITQTADPSAELPDDTVTEPAEDAADAQDKTDTDEADADNPDSEKTDDDAQKSADEETDEEQPETDEADADGQEQEEESKDADNQADADTPEGDNADADNPEGTNQDAENADTGNPEGDNQDTENADVGNPEGNNQDTENADAGNPEDADAENSDAQTQNQGGADTDKEQNPDADNAGNTDTDKTDDAAETTDNIHSAVPEEETTTAEPETTIGPDDDFMISIYADGEGLGMHVNADVDSRTILYVPSEEKVLIDDTLNGWGHISYAGTTGWIWLGYTKIEGDAYVVPPQTVLETPEQRTIGYTGEGLDMRTGPGTRYSSFGRIPDGTVVTIEGYDETGEWAYTSYDGHHGWVNTYYLQ